MADLLEEVGVPPVSIVLRFEEPMRRWRFLISDGQVVDVDARRDDSHLRSWLLRQLGATKTNELCIVGATQLPDQDALL